MMENELTAPKSYVVVVTCVVLREASDGELQALVLKRGERESEGPGLWTIPGGKIRECDWGEPYLTQYHGKSWCNVLKRAIAREVFEETGINVAPHDFTILDEGERIFVRANGTPTLVLTYYLLLEGNPDCVRLDDSATDCAWVREDELGEYQFIGDVKERIKDVFFKYAAVIAMRQP